MKKYLFSLLTSAFILLVPSYSVIAATFTSAGVGPASWNVNTSWVVTGTDADGIPDADDDVTIELGHTITTNNTNNCGTLTINGVLSFLGGSIGIRGTSYVVNSTGSQTGTGYFVFWANGTVLSGTGARSSGTRYTFIGSSTIASGTSITTTTAMTIYPITLTNNGTLKVYTVTTYAGSTFVNGANANLEITYPGFMAGRTFNATAANNTVTVSYANNPIPVTTGQSFVNLVINGGGTGNSLPAATSVTGNLTVNAARTFVCDNDISVSGNWINNGVFTPLTSTVTFNNNSTISGTAQPSFYNLTISGTLAGHATNMNVSNNWVNNGTFTHNSGRVTFNGTTTISGSATTTFNNVTVSGTLNSHATNMNVAGAWINNGTFNHNDATVTFNGNSTISGSATTTFNNITISGALTSTSGNINVVANWVNNGTFTHNNGTVVFNGNTTVSGSATTNFRNITINSALTGHATNMNVAGNWINNGSYTHNNATVTFNGTTTISGASSNTFNNIAISGTLAGPASTNVNVVGNFVNNGTYTHNNGTVTFNGNTTVSGASTTTFNNVTISGILTGSTATVNVAGNWVNNGTFNHNNGTIGFTGTTPITGSTITNFNNVTISGTLTGHPTNMNVVGNWTNNGSYTANNSNVTFTGTSTVLGSSSTTFATVTISGTLNGHATNMNVSSNFINNGVFNANNGTVTFTGTTIVSGVITTFHHLAISGTLNGHATNMNVTGNLTNNGTYDSNNGNITFNGSTNQTLSGSGAAAYEGFILNNASGATVSSGTHILTGVLTITAGVLAQGGGTYTLLADASRYARIEVIDASCTSCGFTGNFIVERYIPERTLVGWANISSPVSGATMGDWDTELFLVYPFNGFDDIQNRPSGSNVMYYSEPTASYQQCSSSTILAPGMGFEIGLTDDENITGFSATTLTSVGTPNYGTHEIPLSLTDAHGPAYPIGYSGANLIGNPFASAIDLSLITITNALPSVDVYDYTIENYKTLSGTDLIGPYQGFWAYAQSSGASMTIPEIAKSSVNNTALQRQTASAKPYLALTIGSADGSHLMQHTLQVASNEQASDKWDTKDHPFRKSLNPQAPSITSNAGEVTVSINTFNNSHETYVMPLNVHVGINGKYRISTTGIKNINTDYRVVLLEDKLTGVFTNLNNSSDYAFDAKTSDSKDRFSLHFSRSSNYQPLKSAYTNYFADQVAISQTEAGNLIRFDMAETTNATISVMDLLGKNIVENTLVEASNQAVNITLPSEFRGMYLIVVQSAQGKVVKKFTTVK
jgi:hypothetical protein